MKKFPELDYKSSFVKSSGYSTHNEMIKLNLICQFVLNQGLSKVLDVGCHTGNISIPLGVAGVDVIGVDIDEEDIKIAKKNNTSGNVRFEVKDFLGFNEKFDAILFADIIEHVNNPCDYINKAYEILNEGGWCIVSIPNGFGPFEIFMDIPMQILRKIFGRQRPLGENHVQFFTLGSFRKLLGPKFRIEATKSFHTLNFLPFFNRIKWLASLDYLISRTLPPSMTSRWLIVAKKI